VARTIVEILALAEEPMRAREIGKELRRRGVTETSRAEVNHELYGSLKRLVTKDTEHRWVLKP